MEQKINIAELLKGCPQGMELDCILFNNTVKYGGLDGDDSYPIEIITETDDYFYITKEGYLYNTPNSKCVIFPKGKTSWDGFVPPCKFKEGDVVVTTLGNIAIIRKPIGKELFYVYVLMVGNSFYKDENPKVSVERFASEEEKQKLFDAIKANGYKWNPETKTLEELVEPKFKVGDRVIRTATHEIYIIDHITSSGYVFKNEGGTGFIFGDEHLYELAPNKFDITTLIPFESRVLVREGKTDVWQPAFYGFFNRENKRFHTTSSGTWLKCIPYNEDTKHLTGTTNDCDEYYKIW